MNIDRDKYTEHLKNLPLFLKRDKLNASTYRFYIFLFKTGCKQGSGVIKSTIELIAQKACVTVSDANYMISDIARGGLFDELQITGSKIFIKVKNLETYARLQK